MNSLSKITMVVSTLMAGMLAVSCTNKSGPVAALSNPFSTSQPRPVMRNADIDTRERVLAKVADDLEAQKRKLRAQNAGAQEASSVDVAQLTPARETRLALLTPTSSTDKGLDATKVAINETVASIPRVEAVDAGAGPLARVHAKLVALQSGQRKKPLTILHIGDSHVASDSFSRGIRAALQARYGDAGRGMVIPARAFKYGVADQIKLNASGNWRSETALKRRTGRFGLSGVSVASRSSRSSMTLTSETGAFDWVEATVATGPSQGAFTLKVGGKAKRFDAYSPKKGSRNFRLEAAGVRATLTPGGGAQTTVLNWATGKNRPGIRYVNFGLIGATVDITQRFDPQLVANDVRRLDPDLIIYGYGTNEGFDDHLDLAAYAKRASAYVKTLRDSAPNADLVYLGAASGLRRKGKGSCGGWSAPPKLEPLRKQVEQMAARQNAAYWDWSDAMGGTCAINSWASKGLAAKDRVHLSSKGYERSADAFSNWLMQPGQSNVAVALN